MEYLVLKNVSVNRGGKITDYFFGQVVKLTKTEADRLNKKGNGPYFEAIEKKSKEKQEDGE